MSEIPRPTGARRWVYYIVERYVPEVTDWRRPLDFPERMTKDEALDLIELLEPGEYRIVEIFGKETPYRYITRPERAEPAR